MLHLRAELGDHAPGWDDDDDDDDDDDHYNYHQIFHTASNWLTLTLAVQRYIYVCHPASAKVRLQSAVDTK